MARSGEKKEITEVKVNNMTVRQIAEELGLRVYTGKTNLDIQVSGAYVSDLLSDVMGNAGADLVWITIMRHLNSVAVASLAGIPLIIFSKGAVPAAPIIEKANQEEICLVTSKLPTFEISGRIYNLLKS